MSEKEEGPKGFFDLEVSPEVQILVLRAYFEAEVAITEKQKAEITTLESEIERLKKEKALSEELFDREFQENNKLKEEMAIFKDSSEYWERQLVEKTNENTAMIVEIHRLKEEKEDNWQMYVDANKQTLLKEARIRKYIEEIERLRSSSEGVREGIPIEHLNHELQKTINGINEKLFGAVEEKKEEPCCEFCGLQSCRDKTCKL